MMTKEYALVRAEEFLKMHKDMLEINNNQTFTFGVRYKAIVLAEEALFTAHEFLRVAKGESV
jgi:hypothetical protein